MKISQVLAEILSENGVSHVFGVSGGASLHLLKSISDHPKLTLICLHHEQSVAMAAEAFSRISGSIGVGIATSGPGATNLITGIAGAFYDSVPVVYITGQVSTSKMKGDKKVRQIGFQETPIVEMVKSITKYAVTIEGPELLEIELRKAISIAQSGRKGPVLIDIPDDIQRQDYQYIGRPQQKTLFLDDASLAPLISNEIILALRNSLQPILVCGAGVQLTSKRDMLIEQLNRLRIPTALTWGAKDLLPGDSEFLLGTFGTHGERFVNLALQEADLIISIGSRLDLKATGNPISSFAPKANKIMFDVDLSEIKKFENSGLKISIAANIDFEDPRFETLIRGLEIDEKLVQPWRENLASMKSRLGEEMRIFTGDGVNPYLFFEKLSSSLSRPSNLIVDTGCAIAWTMQVWNTKTNQRIFHDFNNTAMGWSIPATLASALANPERTQICIVGDGSIMMALSDLSSLSRLNSPIKIIILNNSGYAMIKQTQDQWFESEYFASDAQVDLKFPDFEKIAGATGFNYYFVRSSFKIDESIRYILEDDKPLICEVFIQESARVVPIVKFGNPNYVMEPKKDFSNNLEV